MNTTHPLLRPQTIFIVAVTAVLIYGLGEARVPLLLSGVLAFLMFPLVRWLERRNISRELATWITLMCVMIPLIIILAAALPALYENLIAFVRVLPEKAAVVLERLEQVTSPYGIHLPYQREEIVALMKQQVETASGELIASGTSMLKTSFLSFSAAILALLNVILIPVFYFYVMIDYEKWGTKMRSVVPKEYENEARRILDRSKGILNSYLRGQVIACGVLGLCYGAALELTGLPYGWLIGLLTGFFSFIPYLGFGLGFVIAMIVAMATQDSTAQILLIAAAMGLVQFLESFWITPRLVGNTVGLSALEAILALIIFGNLFGFFGILFAIPIGAVFKEIVITYGSRSKAARDA
jgi:predicted PurR-regulated permease PerM